MDDLLDLYVRATEHVPSPLIFRKWAGLGMIAGALSRKVWTRTKAGIVYPNLYAMFVAEPGIGKSSSMKVARDQLRQFPGSPFGRIELAPTSTTIQALLKEMGTYFSASKKGKPQSYIIMADELGTLFEEWKPQHFATLAKIWDMDEGEYRKTTKTQGKDVLVDHYTSMIVGATPQFLATGLPPEAFRSGLTRRVLFVFSDQEVSWVDRPDPEDMDKALHQRIKALTKIEGEVKYTDEARAMLHEWWRTGAQPRPTDPLLQTYVPSRGIHVSKLATLMALAKHPNERCIEPEDLERAQQWLFEIEARMPEALECAGGNPFRHVEKQVMEFVQREYERTDNPIPESAIRQLIGRSVSSRGDISQVFEEIVRQERLQWVNKLPGVAMSQQPFPRKFKPRGAK